jgi:hypothetical protein
MSEQYQEPRLPPFVPPADPEWLLDRHFRDQFVIRYKSPTNTQETGTAASHEMHLLHPCPWSAVTSFTYDITREWMRLTTQKYVIATWTASQLWNMLAMT